MGQFPVEHLLPAPDMVLIGPADGIKTGMGLSPDREEAMHGYIPGQFAVDPEKEILVIRHFPDTVHMCIEDPGMDPRVSPATTGNSYIFPKQQAEILVQDLLNRADPGLDLPAMIMGAIV